MKVYVSGTDRLSKRIAMIVCMLGLETTTLTSEVCGLTADVLMIDDILEIPDNADAEEYCYKNHDLIVPRRHHSTYHMLHTWLPT